MMTKTLTPPAVFTDVTAKLFVRAVADAMERAGLSPYVDVGYTDSEVRGLEKWASNRQPWAVHDPDAGSPCEYLISKPGPGQAVIGVEVWGTRGSNSLYEWDDDGEPTFEVRYWAVAAMADRIGEVLRADGLDVHSVQYSGADVGWGTRNVGFAVLFTKGGKK